MFLLKSFLILSSYDYKIDFIIVGFIDFISSGYQPQPAWS